MHRSGFAALIGRPNVGKSTLLNALVGEKIAIMSDRPQTTRNQIRAVLTRPEYQVVFIDTPGLHKPKHILGTNMVRTARTTMDEVDLICFLVEADQAPGSGDRYIADLMGSVESPIFLVLNKVDLVKPGKLEEYETLYRQLLSFDECFRISALQNSGLEALVETILKYLPEGPQFYPPEMITDQPEKFIAAEIIREKVIHLTRQEVPFSIAVVIEEMKPRSDGDLLDLRAEIFVERKSQVGIIVGKGGNLLKKAGTAARVELEAIFGQRIFLDLRVKVKPDWRNREEQLRRLGYS